VLHSGTVGAALTGATHGCRALAISLELGDPPKWDSAEMVAAVVIDRLLGAEGDVVLNVNVPDRARDDLRSLERAHLADFGAVTATITEQGAGHVKVAFRALEADAAEGTDVAFLAAGHPTYTPMRTVCEDDQAVV
jgi:5'-nucleotidase